jgi:hypothetical protein
VLFCFPPFVTAAAASGSWMLLVALLWVTTEIELVEIELVEIDAVEVLSCL